MTYTQLLKTRYRGLLGTKPDRVVADIVGCCLWLVRDIRTKLGISPYWRDGDDVRRGQKGIKHVERVSLRICQ